MKLIDLDAIDWTKLPVDFMQYVSVDNVREFLGKQPVHVAFTITSSKNPVIRTKALETLMDFNRFIINMTQTLALMAAEKGDKK